MDPEQSSSHVKTEIQRWAHTVEISGAKAQ
jgi:hypothetical protein